MRSCEERAQDVLGRVQEQKARRSRKAKILSAAASCLALVLAFNLVLFLPYNTSPPDLSAYKNSEYYSLMQQINELTYRKPAHKNNFEAWFGDLFNGADGEAPTSPDGGSSSEGTYAEVTDNQVQGVIEGDLFKRTDEYIFYLTSANFNMFVNAYTIAQGESEYCGMLDIPADEQTYFRTYFDSDGNAEMYLSADGDTITIFAPVWSYEHSQLYTAAVSVDVSDPANMREIGRTYVSGSYVTSRKIGDDFLLISNFTVRPNPDFSDEAQYLPQAGALNDLKSLPVGDIVCPDGADAARYTVVTRLNENAETEDCLALFSFTEEAYVSQNNIFVTRGYESSGEADGENVAYSYTEARTQIACIAYADGGLRLKGSADVAGEVLNQYSMDERDGLLRVVTTLDRNLESSDGGESTLPDIVDKNAALYAIDLTDFETAASLENFAPNGESVISVRFEENIAWVCTAVKFDYYIVDDPVFRIDLSDLSNITFTDTGTIPGYSLSLVDFTYGTLLGVGYNDNRDLKIEIYEQAEGAVDPVTAYERNADFSEDYKAYFIDREKALIGLHVYDYREGSRYLLLHFDGYELSPVLDLPLENDNTDTTRATLVDGWLYVITLNGEDFLAEPLPGLSD